MQSGSNGGGKAPLVRRLSDQVNRATEAALFAAMVLLTVVTTLQVVFRFFFTALSWSEELSCFLLVLASLLGTAVAFKRGTHIAITFLIDRVSARIRKLLLTVVQVLGLVFFAVVSIYGALLMDMESSQLTPALQISISWVYLMYPVLGVVIILHLIDGLLTIWKGGTA